MNAKSTCTIQTAALAPNRFIRYRTPWCDMLGCCSTGSDILHLYYHVNDIAEEVSKRTAYLGKHRRTEDTSHLLDLIHMTSDERELFDSYVKVAMEKVFEPLGVKTKRIRKGYLLETNSNSIDLGDSWGMSIIENASIDTILSGGTITEDAEDREIPDSIIDNIISGSTIAAETDSDCEIPTATIDTIVAGTYVDVEETLQEYHDGDYVIINDALYLANGDGNSANLENVALTTDFRECVHYALEWTPELNKNYIKPLDDSIEEALVCYIIWRWLLSAYPDDAKTYAELFADALNDVRRNSGRLIKETAERIPRIF